MICVMDRVGDRCNGLMNYTRGLKIGFELLGEDVFTLWYDHRQRVDWSSIPKGCNRLLLPYWAAPFRFRFGELKGLRPRMEIGVLMEAHLTRGFECVNDNHVDHLFMVNVNPYRHDYVPPVIEVGMGILPEIKCGPKSQKPVVVIDRHRSIPLDVYDAALRVLAGIVVPGMRVIVLNPQGDMERVIPQDNRILIEELLPFDQIVEIWRMSWAYVTFRESFGYAIVENYASGTPVFSNEGHLISPAHEGHIRPLRGLGDHVEVWKGLPGSQRQIDALRCRREYFEAHPQFQSWERVCSLILESYGPDFEEV